MSLYQGLIGAKVELAACKSTSQRLKSLTRITKIFADEIVGTFKLAPYAYHSWKIHKELPSYHPKSSSTKNAPTTTSSSNSSSCNGSGSSALPTSPVYLARDVPYGDQPRLCMDIYLPAEALLSAQTAETAETAAPEVAAAAAAGGVADEHQRVQADVSSKGAPVMVFCHGGVWAAGEKWHYAPMAAHLAQLGIIACVVQYALYPDALVPQMVGEVSRAFTWVLDHVHKYGGDVQRVSLVGHSAGAHLCQMALLQRAAAAHAQAVTGTFYNTFSNSKGRNGTAATTTTSSSSSGSMNNGDGKQQHITPSSEGSRKRPSADTPVTDPRMPMQFIALCGVYDIAQHYVYEEGRGVHELSTMKRAMGGFEGFAAMSPSVILRQALQQAEGQEAGGSGSAGAGTSSRGLDTEVGLEGLSGEAISHRIGFVRAGATWRKHSATRRHADHLRPASTAPAKFPLAAAAYLPPTILVSSCTDVTVPWYESAEMYWHLFDAGVPVKHLVYNKVGHGDFVVQWPLDLHTASAAAAADWGHSPTAADDWGAEMASGAATAIADAAGAAAAVVSGNAAGAAAGTEAVGLGRDEEEAADGAEGVGETSAAVGAYDGLTASTRRSSSSSSSSEASATGRRGSWSGDLQALSPGAGAAAGVSLLGGSIGSAACTSDEMEDRGSGSHRQEEGYTVKGRIVNVTRAKERAALLEVLPLHNQDLAKLVGCFVKPSFAVHGRQ